jgi:hypothetical protein
MGDKKEGFIPLNELPDFKYTPGPPPPPKPFPYWPAQPSEEELKRNELMMELNKWANNDQDIAKRTAETLIELLQKQFLIKPEIKKEVVYVQEQ